MIFLALLVCLFYISMEQVGALKLLSGVLPVDSWNQYSPPPLHTHPRRLRLCMGDDVGSLANELSHLHISGSNNIITEVIVMVVRSTIVRLKGRQPQGRES